MKLSLNWLKSLIPVPMNTEELAHALTMAGLEVEAVERPFAHLDGIVTGRIFDIAPHPNADKLQTCKVDTGNDIFSVVCGAPNIENGMMAPLAPAGTTMPDGTVLKKGKIRGEVSEGMLCSARELNLDNDHSGILALPQETPPGSPFCEAMEMDDTVLTIGLTPNRVDCASVMGLAREVAAFGESSFRAEPVSLPPADPALGKIDTLTSVTVEDSEGCPRYAARLLADITVGPSPAWLKNRLIAAGLRPINNIVDITNFVMLETGQPLHAFDFDTLAQGRIVVRKASEGETFITLDEKERRLDRDMVMICDGEKPVAIGGVMGGLHSGVTESTRRVLIESACFDAPSIRRTAKKLGLSTDSSYRFERGVDPLGTLYALDKAAALMLETGGGRMAEGCIDVHPTPPAPRTIGVSPDFINQRIGLNLSAEQMILLLEKVGFSAGLQGKDIEVTVPSFRVDVSRREDISEEVARLYGYDNIPVTFPEMPAETRLDPPSVTFRRRLQDQMCGLGFHEVISYSFVAKESADHLRLPGDHPMRPAVALLNPISEDLAIMRTSMVPGLLGLLARNIAQQEKSLKIFETGSTFTPLAGEDLPVEREVLALAWTGKRHPGGWYEHAPECDFFDLKGAVESLLEAMNIPGADYAAPDSPDSFPWVRKGACACIRCEGSILGHIYEVHPETRRFFGIKQPVFMAEMDLILLMEKQKDLFLSKEIPRYPATTRDVTLILDKEIPAAEVLKISRENQPEILESVSIHDLYQGDRIPAGKKSLTLRMVYRSLTETLADKKVNKIQEKITQNLLSHFQATLPG
ncbi:phenylalanyl-tRNA synthetase beta subunit [Desulfobotulus alkaliphilus]|uniref:Phenylalanine--tRNA ligase beta subunit n=1 Tax=Desulfobotulus alkaliphilus TaxID=622671 RepID=A0A562RC85_9BACT|nr:phenylalanine--tRNA ligase subunit beta [Desulfobotulus alkaliphilus]TWI66040.1 phenylalanyl-tRNA synthetase beta subunit [Desulfobotulus alkaliphilus]